MSVHRKCLKEADSLHHCGETLHKVKSSKKDKKKDKKLEGAPLSPSFPSLS